MWRVAGLSDGRWALVLKAHHTMVDGRTGADLVRMLLTDAPVLRAPGAPVAASRPDAAGPWC
jgi:diacylglycerol O-acyltransferase